METAALVAPVTALEFIQDELLLSGDGPVLTVYSLPTCPKRTSALIVLQHQRIHGIRPRELQQGGQTNTVYNLAVFGGKAFVKKDYCLFFAEVGTDLGVFGQMKKATGPEMARWFLSSKAQFWHQKKRYRKQMAKLVGLFERGCTEEELGVFTG
uniref:Uncharacterized protein n=1 Tax=Knipowitschia caucasica TaxID=637954 RepID=A0AAV2LXX3_KNICA